MGVRPVHFEKFSWEELCPLAFQALGTTGGLLLVTQGKEHAATNVMTIGWVSFGVVWGRPVACVLVRPSRFTHVLLEETLLFTINVPPTHLRKAVEECGKYSGRTMNKFTHCALTPVYLGGFPVPSIAECVATVQCAVVEKTRVEPSTLVPLIQETYYPQGDYHTIYFGEIQTSWKRVEP